MLGINLYHINHKNQRQYYYSMASQKGSMTAALGNMLFKIKDKLGDDEYKKMYELIGEIHNEKSKPYYKVVWLKLTREFDGEGGRLTRWTHVKTISIVTEWMGYTGRATSTNAAACVWLNKNKMGDPCMMSDTGALYFYNENSEYEDGREFLIDPDTVEDGADCVTITGGYFISIEEL